MPESPRDRTDPDPQRLSSVHQEVSGRTHIGNQPLSQPSSSKQNTPETRPHQGSQTQSTANRPPRINNPPTRTHTPVNNPGNNTPPSVGQPGSRNSSRNASPGRNPPNPNPNPGPNPPNPPNPGNMAAANQPAVNPAAQPNQPQFFIKYPKPDKFYGDPTQFRPWLSSLTLYYNSYGIATAESRINYALGLLYGAAAAWRQDYIATHNAQNAQTWDEFTVSMEQSFAPAQQAHEAEKQLRRLKQGGGYIGEYIANFGLTASQAGLTGDNVAIRSYFAEGLDPAIRHEALRSDPQTLEQWKTAARNAYRIVTEQQRFRQSNGFRRPSKKGQGKGKGNRSNPRYTSVHNQPILPQFRRSEWDMDVDYYNQSINEIDDDDFEEEEYNEVEEDSEEEDINYTNTKPRRATDKDNNALHHLINNVLTDEQRTALRKGECFFCHKQGHFYRDCAARKVYLNTGRKKTMGNKPSRQSNNRPSNQKRKPNFKKKVDPNAMVYNFEEDDENPSEDEDF